MEISTYPEMDEKIVALLRLSGGPVELYAAKRIEELEELTRNPSQEMNLKRRVETANGRLWCPYAAGLSSSDCVAELCAHYHPETEECFHVEVVTALETIAVALAYICIDEQDEGGKQTMQPRQQMAEWVEMARELEYEVCSLTSKAARVIAARPEDFHAAARTLREAMEDEANDAST